MQINSKYSCEGYTNSTIRPIPIKADCDRCALGRKKAIGGIGPDDLSKVRLIVFSDYPGTYEEARGWPMVPANLERKKTTQVRSAKRNAGQLVRDTITQLGLCHWSEVYYSNVIKCNPIAKDKGLIPINEHQHLYPCISQWLMTELSTLDKYVPQVPILIGGKWATKAFIKIYNLNAKDTNDLRGKVWYLDRHPAIFTYNPAVFARGEAFIESQVMVDPRTELLKVISVEPTTPVVGSPMWFYQKDIKLLKSCICLS